MREPAMPRSIVIMKPPGSFPGMMALAIRRLSIQLSRSSSCSFELWPPTPVSAQSCNNIDYLVTGGAGKLSTKTPDKFTEARTISWSANYHFLLVTVDGKRMTVRAIGQLSNGKLVDIARKAPNKTAV